MYMSISSFVCYEYREDKRELFIFRFFMIDMVSYGDFFFFKMGNVLKYVLYINLKVYIGKNEEFQGKMFLERIFELGDKRYVKLVIFEKFIEILVF